jgi:hypothetical protein
VPHERLAAALLSPDRHDVARRVWSYTAHLLLAAAVMEERGSLDA